MHDRKKDLPAKKSETGVRLSFSSTMVDSLGDAMKKELKRITGIDWEYSKSQQYAIATVDAKMFMAIKSCFNLQGIYVLKDSELPFCTIDGDIITLRKLRAMTPLFDAKKNELKCL